MREFNDDEVLDRVESLPSFTGWRRGAYDIWIRSQADVYDAFDDKAFLFWAEKDGERPSFILARKGTSNAGSYGLQHFDDYNREGCAVLKSDVIVYNSHVKGFHKRNRNNPAYVQAKPFPYYRDGNKNKRAEEIGLLHWDVIGANVHRAGVNSTVIKNWSVACLVTAQNAAYNQFMNFMASKHYPPLSVAILKEWAPGAAKPQVSRLHLKPEVEPDDSVSDPQESDLAENANKAPLSDLEPPADTQAIPGGENATDGQQPPAKTQIADNIINAGGDSAQPSDTQAKIDAAKELPDTEVKEKEKTGFLSKLWLGVMAIATGQYVIPDWLTNGIDFSAAFRGIGTFVFEMRFWIIGALLVWFVVNKLESMWIRGRVISNNADPTKGNIVPVAHISIFQKARKWIGRRLGYETEA